MSAPSKAVVDSWQTAFDSLDSGLKASLISAKGEKLDALNSVLDEAEQQRKRCLQKRWKIQLHGKVIILRDVFDKIITWVNEFKAVGDVAMQVNQTAASLPWAGVRFLLQVCTVTAS